jgi:hypothetical protein
MKRLLVGIFFCCAISVFGQMQIKNSSQNILVTLTNAGSLGIGLTNPQYKLHVQDDIATTRNVLVGYQNGSTAGVFITRNTEYGIPAVQSVTSTFGVGSLGINPGGGNVGIGISNPTAQLHTTSTVRFAGVGVGNTNTRLLSLDSQGNVAYRELATLPVSGDNLGNHIATQNIQLGAFWLSRSTNADGIAISAANNVGIGTDAPENKLHVGNGYLRVKGYAEMSSNGSGWGLFAGNAYLDDGVAPSWLQTFKYAGTHVTIGAIGFAVNYPAWNYAGIVRSPGVGSTKDETFTPVSVLTVTPSNYVGIGTTEPSRMLEVSRIITCGDVTGRYGEIGFGQSHLASWPNRYSEWTQNLEFVTYDTWRYKEDGAGGVINLGGVAGCDAATPTKGSMSVLIADPGTKDATIVPTAVIVAYKTGVGILKAPDAAYALDVNGNIRGNSFSPSDVRFKENIHTIGQALSLVENLRGVTFDWRQKEFPKQNFDQGEQIGLIAQEVQSILPQVVAQDEEGYLAVNYAKLVPILVEAIKEMNQEIKELRTLVNNK